MNIEQVSKKFNKWQRPWEFIDYINNSLHDSSEDLALARSIWDDANNEDIWLNASSLSDGVHEIENILNEKYQNIDKEALKLFVRSASYSWR